MLNMANRQRFAVSIVIVKMPRPGKRLRRIVLAAALLLIAAVVAGAIMLPSFARGKVSAALAAIGAPRHEFELASISPGGLRLERVSLGQPAWGAAERIDVGFSLASLLRGRLGTITIHDARWTVHVTDDGIVLGPQPPAGPARDLDLPFRALRLENSTLIVNRGDSGVQYSLPFEGRLTNPGDSTLAIDFATRALDRAISIEGELTSTAALLKFDVAATAADGAAPERLSLRGTVDRTGSAATTLAIHLRANDLETSLAGRTITAGPIAAELHGEIASDMALRSLVGDIAIDDMRIAGEPIDSLSLVFAEGDTGPQYALAASGDGWAVESIDGLLGPLVDQLRGASDEPFITSWKVHGEMRDDVQQLFAQRGIGIAREARFSAELITSTAVSSAADSSDEAAPGGVRLTIGMTDASHVSLESDALAARFPALSGNATVAARTGRPVTIEAKLHVNGATITTREPGIAADGISAAASLSFGNERAEKLAGEITLNVPPFEIDDPHALSRLIPALGGVELGGEVELTGRIDIRGGALHPFITLRGENLWAYSDDWAGEIETASGEITIDSFSPLTTPPDQVIRIEKALYGKHSVEDAELRFALAPGGKAEVQQAAWNMPELGSFQASPFAIDLARPVIHTALSAWDLELYAWLPLLTDGRATGDGQLHGRINFAYDPQSRFKLFLGDGVLSADEPGFVQVNDADALALLMEQSDARFSSDERLAAAKQGIIDALGDFRYSAFHVELEQRQRQTAALIRVEGRGREGAYPQALSLDLNVNDFGIAVALALLGKSHLDRAEEIGIDVSGSQETEAPR